MIYVDSKKTIHKVIFMGRGRGFYLLNEPLVSTSAARVRVGDPRQGRIVELLDPGTTDSFLLVKFDGSEQVFHLTREMVNVTRQFVRGSLHAALPRALRLVELSKQTGIV